MSTKLNQPWVPLERIESFVQIEPALILIGLVLGAWFFSRTFLSQIVPDRQRKLKLQFKSLIHHCSFGLICFLLYHVLDHIASENMILERVTTYLGLLTIFSGSIIFIKVLRILLSEYLYLIHMNVVFPVLLVNLFTLILSILLASWIGSEIFNIRLTALLATSAIFSLILGLALQETLGNLFSGVALQFDQSYEIGDWLEIQTDGNKWTGKVYEISWRSTILINFTEETIIIPNRIMGQAQISNFSTHYRPIIRSQVFRLPFGVDMDQVKWVLISTIKNLSEHILHTPPPRVLLSETTESWIGFKLIYYINDYGKQFIIADAVLEKGIINLETAGFQLASQRIQVHSALITQPLSPPQSEKSS